jgi:hypothetical protein
VAVCDVVSMLGFCSWSAKTLEAAPFARPISGARLNICPAACAENRIAGRTMKNCRLEYSPDLTCFAPHQYAREYTK